MTNCCNIRIKLHTLIALYTRNRIKGMGFGVGADFFRLEITTAFPSAQQCVDFVTCAYIPETSPN